MGQVDGIDLRFDQNLPRRDIEILEQPENTFVFLGRGLNEQSVIERIRYHSRYALLRRSGSGGGTKVLSGEIAGCTGRGPLRRSHHGKWIGRLDHSGSLRILPAVPWGSPAAIHSSTAVHSATATVHSATAVHSTSTTAAHPAVHSHSTAHSSAERPARHSDARG